MNTMVLFYVMMFLLNAFTTCLNLFVSHCYWLACFTAMSAGWCISGILYHWGDDA